MAGKMFHFIMAKNGEEEKIGKEDGVREEGKKKKMKKRKGQGSGDEMPHFKSHLY